MVLVFFKFVLPTGSNMQGLYNSHICSKLVNFILLNFTDLCQMMLDFKQCASIIGCMYILDSQYLFVKHVSFLMCVCLFSFFSLLFIKTVLGVILLRTAWRYHDKMKKEEQETSASTRLAGHPKRHSFTNSNVFDDVVESSSSTSRSENRKLKSKSLSDIERFTMCSSRII